MVDGAEVSDRKSVANHFNDFFSTIGSTLARRFTPRQFTIFSPRVETDFKFVSINPDDLQKSLRKLTIRKATGLDGISSRMLRRASEYIHIPLAYIINASLRTGVFPAEWKLARVTPLFKSGDRCDLGNYRPISILPVVSKLIEGVVHGQLYRALSNSEVLSEFQSGFRPGFSNTTSAAHLVDYILTGMDGRGTEK